MRTFPQIGERLRAYRIGSGLTVDETAVRLGVSRAALYRYEAGEVIKLETIERLGRLFGVSMTALLGVGIEYFSNGVTFFERLRQLEESANHVTVVFGPVAFVLTSDDYDAALLAALTEAEDEDERLTQQEASTLGGILKSRKTAYCKRQPGLVNIISVSEIERFLCYGLSLRKNLSHTQIYSRTSVAIKEITRIADIVARPPMGVQVGLTRKLLPTTGYQLIRQENRSLIVTSPFRIGERPNLKHGIATISDAQDAINVHQALADQLWSSVLLGNTAVGELKKLINAQLK